MESLAIITKTEGYFIINTAPIAISGGVVSYRDDAVVQEFDTEAEMRAVHESLYPEQYE